MQRVRVFLRDDQKVALRSISARTGEKQSDLIRKSVDILIDRSKQQDTDWREATRVVAGLWQGRTDIDHISDTFRVAVRRRLS